jgi:hypothetical protein
VATPRTRAQAPSAAELEHCLQRAGLELKLHERDLRLLSAQKFALGRASAT